jgi:hypothetical protein
MGLAHSPKAVTNGLVFAHDMANTQKSWKGVPTENLIAISGSDAGILRSGVGYSYYGVNINSAVQSRWSAGNNQLTLSFEGKRDYSIGGTGSGNDGYPQAYVYFNDWSWAVAVGVDTYSWSRNSVSFTMPNPAGKTVMFDIYHMNAGNPGFSYSRNHQVEFSTYATPFVNGTRSNTQAILDPVGKNTITASSLTYAANGSYSFNGSSNYIVVTNNSSLQLPTTLTLEAWVKPTSSSGLGNIMSKNENNGYRFRVQNEVLWCYSNGNGLAGGSVPNGQWAHVAVTMGPAGLTNYVNGVVTATTATAYTPANVINGDLFVGAYGIGSELFHGSISLGRIYNRVLTAAEILQNFNAHRGSYGI